MKVINIAFGGFTSVKISTSFEKKLRFKPSGEEEVESLTGELR